MRTITSLLIIALLTLTGCSKSKNRPADTETTTTADTSAASDDRGELDPGNSKHTGDWPPSPALITADLTGHTLRENTSNGYHKSDWVYEIEYGDVSDLKVVEVLTLTETKYLVIAEMNLAGGKNFYYHTKARINYTRTAKDPTPVLDYVISLGMEVVSDGEYDGYITGALVDDGWGGVNCLQLTNNGEVALVVAGKLLNNDGWQKFSQVIPPHERVQVGGTFAGGSVQDFTITFVVRTED